MGHRANFVVIQNSSTKAYWDNWAALGSLYSFAAGPDEAIKFLTDFKPTTELLDWAFAEGGYLLDFDASTAIIFGFPIDEAEFEFFGLKESPDDEQTEEFMSKYLQEIASKWTGWKLIFDDRGVDAFASYLQLKNIKEIKWQPASHPTNISPPCELQA
ncbi:MAG: hypothetical protein D3914_10270 [Candidatus Electrothrix sp. LOE2]|nr:hypothetical protein [Candidatus Electrothrix sp. LOE2]